MHTATIEKIRKGVARAMKDPAVIDKLRKNYVAQTPETREKMKEKMKMRYGLQLHKKAFGPQSKKCNTVATDGVAVFHCHIGCCALVGFRRVGWRRGLVYERPRAKRKVRRKMTQEELEVCCSPVRYESTQSVSAGACRVLWWHHNLHTLLHAAEEFAADPYTYSAIAIASAVLRWHTFLPVSRCPHHHQHCDAELPM